MTKADLVDKITAKTKLPKTAVDKALNAILDAMQDVLVSEGKLTLTGFGTFAVESRQARQGRIPRTGENITIPAAKVVRFRPGKGLKDTVK